MPKPSKKSHTSHSTSPASASSTTRQQTIDPTQLGLRTQDVAIFRQHQSNALSHAGGANGTGTTRAATQAATQGRVLVDAASLGLLATHFDRVMGVIRGRLDVLQQQTQISVQRQASRTQHTIQSANAEIARMHAILQQIDDLETEFDKIRQIRDIVAGFRARVEALERRVG